MKYNDEIIWKVTKYNWFSIKESSHIVNTKAKKFYKQILKSRNLFVHIHHFKRKNNKQTHTWNLLDLTSLHFLQRDCFIKADMPHKATK